MNISTLIMAILAVIFLIIAYIKGGGAHIIGVKAGANMFFGVLPILIFSFLIAGLFQVLMPRAVIEKWLGEQAGLKGILIGSLAGAITPGGPYVSFPIVASIYKSGAGIGTTVAYVTSWSLCAFFRLPFEISLIGVKFALIRFACTFFFPPIAGIIAKTLFR